MNKRYPLERMFNIFMLMVVPKSSYMAKWLEYCLKDKFELKPNGFRSTENMKI